jgi:NAD(P)-dependent dehydrogenase (short-subunit alcohol dehydrogenase family)
MSASRPFAIVTGASTGIGFELAKRCAKEGYDLLIAADEPEIEKASGWRRSSFHPVVAFLRLRRPDMKENGKACNMP